MADMEKNEILSKHKNGFEKGDLFKALVDFLGLLFLIMAIFAPIFVCSPNFIDNRKMFSLANAFRLTCDAKWGGVYANGNFLNQMLLLAIIFVTVFFIVLYIIKLAGDVKKFLLKPKEKPVEKSLKNNKRKISAVPAPYYIITLLIGYVLLSLEMYALRDDNIDFSYMSMFSGISFWGVLTIVILLTYTITIILKNRERDKQAESTGETIINL